MSESERDYDLSLQALRAEVHPQVDKARVRARLVARGVLASAGAGTATAATAKAAASWGAVSTAKLAAGLTLLMALSVVVVQSTAPAPAERSKVLGHAFAWPLRGRPARQPAFVQHATEKATAPRGQAPRAAVRTSRAAVHAPHASDPVLDLARENALISAAVTALRAGDGARASTLLDQHEREFPAGFLRAERETVRRRVGEAARAGSALP